jgi:hypothetical protein
VDSSYKLLRELPWKGVVLADVEDLKGGDLGVRVG